MVPSSAMAPNSSTPIRRRRSPGLFLGRHATSRALLTSRKLSAAVSKNVETNTPSKQAKPKANTSLNIQSVESWRSSQRFSLRGRARVRKSQVCRPGCGGLSRIEPSQWSQSHHISWPFPASLERSRPHVGASSFLELLLLFDTGKPLRHFGMHKKGTTPILTTPQIPEKPFGKLTAPPSLLRSKLKTTAKPRRLRTG